MTVPTFEPMTEEALVLQRHLRIGPVEPPCGVTAPRLGRPAAAPLHRPLAAIPKGGASWRADAGTFAHAVFGH